MKTSRVVVVAGALGLLAIAFLIDWSPPSSSGSQPSVPWSRDATTSTSAPAIAPRLAAGTSRRVGEAAVGGRPAALRNKRSSTVGGHVDGDRDVVADQGQTHRGSAGDDVTMRSALGPQDGNGPVVPRNLRNRRARASDERVEEMLDVPVESAGVLYDSGDDGRFSTDARVEVPESGRLSGSSGSVSFQFEPAWSGDNQADATLVEIGDGRLRIRKNVSYLRLEMTGDDGTEGGTGMSLAKWQPGETYQVTATWGDGTLALYVDGQLAAQRHYADRFEISDGTPVYIGNGPQGTVAPGALSHVQLSTEQLSPAQIAERAELAFSRQP